MKIFKFGGASVKDPDAVRNVCKVIQGFPDDDLVVVVSAMGKTTNAMEDVWKYYVSGDASAAIDKLEEVRLFHEEIILGIGISVHEKVWRTVKVLLDDLRKKLSETASENRDFEYDQIVSIGELLSTIIVNEYMLGQGLHSQWFDARKIVRTDDNYREGGVDWEKTKELTSEAIGSFLDGAGTRIAVMQGFLGHSESGATTTLGREGSDYTGAIMAYCLDGESLTIWKDVPGVLNADPKWFKNTVKLSQISYREAIELSYYGASVIHPKTLKPLQNKQIPLLVRSFLHPEKEGTEIQTSTASDFLVPSFIFKMDQVLISVSPRDFSFIIEENLSDIFHTFAEHKVKINMMQNSALNFSASVDNSEKIPALIDKLKEEFKVLYNEGLELVTIRHYDQSTIDRVTENKSILVEQKSRFTARMVMRDEAGPYAPHMDYPH